MRKLNNPMPAGGAPFNNEDLIELFNTEIWGVLEGICSKYANDAEGVIVSGCNVTANGGNFDMTAGIVYLNGEFMRVDAVTNQTYTKYIKANTATNVSRTFADLASKTFIIEKKAQVSGTVDAGGQEITISSLYSSLYRRLDFLEGGCTYRTAAGVESVKKILTRVIEIGDWNMDTTASLAVNMDTATKAIFDAKKVLSVQCMIRNDTDTSIRILDTGGSADDTVTGVGLMWTDGTGVINLYRLTAGIFDTTGYDSTSYNRGWIIITYME